ncbi:MAG: DUF1295 domain-containing protein [Bacilli bacterium]|nr:DUF1295 domain-containing protein [Bacilli bacterium]
MAVDAGEKKLNRALAMMELSAYYLITFGLMSLVYMGFKTLGVHYLLNALIINVIATVVIYVIGLIKKTSSVYDPYWSVQTLLLVVIILANERVFHPIMLIPLAALTFYTCRLTIHFGTTFSGFDYVDWRYKDLREKTGKFFQPVNLLGIHMMPTLLVYGLSIPLIVFLMETPALFESNPVLTTVISIAYALTAIGAVLIEMFADLQLKWYRKKPHVEDATCEEGLWRYSRHPNYLGEISFWAMANILLVSVPSIWWTLFFTIGLIVLFSAYSIPMIEKRMMSHRPTYANYRKVVSPLPLLPRRKAKEEPSASEKKGDAVN